MTRTSAFVDHDACGVGFVAQLGSTGSREVVERALEALRRLDHRGGLDADGRSGDGAGLLTAIPDKFVRNCAREAGIELPSVYALGMVFLPCGQEDVARDLIANLARNRGLQLSGWRAVPTDPSIVGPRALDTLPVIQQCFLAPVKESVDLESDLFGLRKEVESKAPIGTYFCSLSSRTVVYKGLLTPEQLPKFYSDLANPDFASPFAIFHQRYSTNTNPSWSLAQPFRFVAHNGEINTISSNRRWLRAKEACLRQTLGLPATVRLLEERVSDSASFDNGLEIFLRRGYNPVDAMWCMVPPARENNLSVQSDFQSFLEAHAREQEPWDGPAALIFTDGFTVGAKLDRNGLRPLRYALTADGLLVAGSEVGIADLHHKNVIERQRLGPGEMLVADPSKDRLLRPGGIPELGKWRQFVSAAATVRIKPSDQVAIASTRAPKKVLGALGWSEDQFRLLFQPLVQNGQEAVWSMGDDAPSAFLSSIRRPLWEHCKQRFAQVTNPPIDPLREAHVRVQISIYRNFSYKIIEKLENGSIDVGIVTLPVKSPSLKVHSIFRDQLMLMVSPQNPLAKHKHVSVGDIVTQPLLLPRTGYSRRVMDKLFRPYRAHLQVRMELPSIGMIKSFAAAGLGVSLISSSFARDQVMAEQVKLIPLQGVELWRELGLAYGRDRTHTRPTTTFIATVRQLSAIAK